MLLVILTSGAGFVTSYSLLRFGIADIWIRYLSAVAIAYVVFLFLLWLWLRTSAEDYADLDGPDALDLLEFGTRPVRSYRGGGGQFGGGGASGRYDDALPEVEKDTSAFGALDGADSADELAIPLVILIFVIGVVLASFTIVWSAPTLFAELVLDGVLAATLYRHLKKLETRHWLETAIRHTFVPFAITSIVLVGVGLFIAAQFPDARTLGDAIAAMRS